ncbi:MAG: hypothetical protein OEW75_14255 [Cyclobacteriaceae bacterium]|nr:hypothetical protein [Cyclobacteriaceae bacterium]
MNKNNKTVVVLSIIIVLITIFVNYLANALPINGKTTGEISDLYPNLFVPAGFTFLIWGVIYLGLLVYVFYPLIHIKKESEVKLESYFRGKIYFWISCIANILWLLAWHYDFILLSVFFMLLILISLIKLWSIYNSGNTEAPYLKIPISIYFGWISVATITNFTALFVSRGWAPTEGEASLWAIIMLTIAFSLGLYMLLARRDVYFPMVIIWAFLGISGKQMTNDIMVWIMATTYIVFLLVFIVSIPVKRWLKA